MNYRQGDVLIFGVSRKTKKPLNDLGYKDKGDNIIIEGEITGHLHEVLNGKLYEKDGQIVVEAQKGCTLKHPEHDPIALPEGTYKIEIQEEYDEKKHSTKVKD
jgi:hypothetical protein